MPGVFDLNAHFNKPVLDRLEAERDKFKDVVLKTRFERTIANRHTAALQGDKLLGKISDLFFNGMGMKWSPVQQRIFHAAIDACLPKIYGDEWENVKERVLAQRKLPKMKQELLIQMARRNGKTMVVSGISATLMLVIPSMKVAIFSVSERQSKMLMTEIENRIKSAFKQGTHVSDDQFTIKQKNKEKLIYVMNATGTEQEVGSYPGSVRVRLSFSFPPSKKLCCRGAMIAATIAC